MALPALFAPSLIRSVSTLPQWLPLLLTSLLLLVFAPFAQGQRRTTAPVPAVVPRLGPDGRAGIPLPADTVEGRRLSATGRDTTGIGRILTVADTSRSRAGDSLRVAAAAKGALETTVKYKSTDSIRFEVENKTAYLYNKADVTYGKMEMKADLITVNYGTSLVTANGVPDSTGRERGTPVFNDANGLYTARRINYNFKTKKGKIADAITQEGEGYIHAETIKKNPLNELYGLRGRYTTCNLEHPHFYINASKMKVIPGDKVVTGPFNLVIGDIPTPLGFLFGYFPMTKSHSRASGLIIPTFGQTGDRGFFLRNGGYYWAVNDYIGVRVTGDIYSGAAQEFGGFGLTGEMQYIKRYAYNGRLNLSFSQRPANQILATPGVTTDVAYLRPRSPQTFWLSWSHSPVQKPGGGRFSASVQAGSSSYNQQNSFDERRFLTPSFSSTISYQKQIRNSPVNYALNLAQNQNTTTGEMTLTLPDVTVGVARQYPYEWLGIAPRGRFYEQFSIGYTMNGQNRLSNIIPARQFNSGAIPLIGGTSTAQTIPFNLDNLRPLLRNSIAGIQNQFQISLGNYNVLKHFSVSPSVNYAQVIYSKQLNYTYVPIANAVRIDTLNRLSVLGSYSAGVSVGTNVYGIVQFKGKKIAAIRHKLTPSVSYSYSPDLNANQNFYTSASSFLPDNYYSSSGQLQTGQFFSRYQGFAYGAPSGSRSSAISFNLQNSVEMKVRDDKDTTGTNPYKKVSLIDGLDLSTSYNFLADEFKLSPLNASFRTQVARKLNISISSTFSFYQRDSTSQLLDRYLLAQPNWRIARLTNATLALTYQFNPAQGARKSAVRRPAAPANDPMLGAPQQVDSYEDYIDFQIPWELNTSFGATYNDPGALPTTNRYLRPIPVSGVSLNLNGSVKLTDNFRLGYSTNYDFTNKQIAFTSIDLYRDLHCWQISGNWRPFGTTRGYNVTIAAKSSLLQDLKLNRNRSFLNR